MQEALCVQGDESLHEVASHCELEGLGRQESDTPPSPLALQLPRGAPLLDAGGSLGKDSKSH